MAKDFSGVGAAAVGTNLTILALESAATIRPKLYEFLIGVGATPVDNATLFHLERFTAPGTEGSGFTPVAIDPANAGLELADYGTGLYSVEPTYTANAILQKLALNQRATFRWIAAPGKELIAPATASNGIGLQSQSSTGVISHDVTMYHEE